MSGEPPLELVVLGRVKGESILVRLGGLGWAVVDSFNVDERPAALRWLDEHGIDAGDVRWVVATHWHADHVAGLEVVLGAAHADCLFAYPAVNDPEQLAQMAAAAVEAERVDGQVHAAGAFARVLDALVAKGAEPTPVKACHLLVRRGATEMLALSPTRRAVNAGLVSVGAALSGERPGLTVASPAPNLTSVAIMITAGQHCVLLGADLEAHADHGWPRAVAETSDVRLDRRASLLKVPHHGSSDADHPSLWEGLLEPEPLGVVTPFGSQRPQAEDVARLSGRCLDLRIAAGAQWPGWTWVASAIHTAVPASRAVTADRAGWIRYTARPGGGWAITQGVL